MSLLFKNIFAVTHYKCVQFEFIDEKVYRKKGKVILFKKSIKYMDKESKEADFFYKKCLLYNKKITNAIY